MLYPSCDTGQDGGGRLGTSMSLAVQARNIPHTRLVPPFICTSRHTAAWSTLTSHTPRPLQFISIPCRTHSHTHTHTLTHTHTQTSGTCRPLCASLMFPSALLSVVCVSVCVCVSECVCVCVCVCVCEARLTVNSPGLGALDWPVARQP